jgi:hypothetical protein
MTTDFSLRQGNPGIEVSVKHRMAQPAVPVRVAGTAMMLALNVAMDALST